MNRLDNPDIKTYLQSADHQKRHLEQQRKKIVSSTNCVLNTVQPHSKDIPAYLESILHHT